MSQITEGVDCPDFSLPDDRGETLRLADLKDRPFVLFFYPKDDTSGCTQESIDFTELKRAFDTLGVDVIGVSPDAVKSHAKFRDKHGLGVRLLSDEDKSLLSAFGLWVEKSMYGKSYMGVERTTVLTGRDGKIARVWRKVKVPGHAAEVLAAARTLLS